MNRTLDSFCDGYAKVIRLFPNAEEGIRTDWEQIGRDIEVSIKRYKQELDSEICQKEIKTTFKQKRKRKLQK